ncbi:primosomal protein DnaI [Kurthia sibirica]|uniref:Primosomal protein DnaI n=1 Tax=Kurthia sibirica TaxID=202750 RepID=A0A2U3ANQ5_9BACL|nr:primosomal protein DnaI [Kurthia sibirica]PWI26180.1 primosomal protein DnaI [Kurthia sibirica]GEK35370.1 primosomal protein DnaI [Kurthia sibirica]
MKPIQSEINKQMDANFQQRFNEIQAELLENPAIQKFFQENEAVMSSEIVERGLGKLYEFQNQQHDCSKCPSVAKCVNTIDGFVPKLFINRGLIDIEYAPCQQKRIEDERRLTASKITSMHMPKDVLKATLADIRVYNDERANLLKLAKDFIEEVKTTGELPQKGLYLYGDFGVGKSFLIGAIANELATIQVQSVVVYVPEFLRELKNAIGTPQLEQKIDFVKKASVLMLDDLGAESLSPWTRDEILGAILHYRMAEQLPTFITSNLDYNALEDVIAKTSKGEIEPVKAARIMERIKAITTPVFVEGYNLRNM